MTKKNEKGHFVLGAVVGFFLLTMLAWRHLILLSKDFQPQLVEIHVGIVSFYSGFKAWQNRILVAGLQAAMAKIVGSQSLAWQVNLFLLFFLSSLFSLYSFILTFRDKTVATGATLFVFLFYVLINDHRVAEWDLIDLAVFSLFTVSIERKKYAPALIAYSIGLINRESALYMPVLPLLQSLSLKKGKWKINPKEFVLSLLALCLGVLWVLFSRSLWKHPADLIGKSYFYGNHLTLINVFHDYSESFFNFSNCAIFFLFLLIAIAAFRRSLISTATFVWFVLCVLSGVLVGGPTEIRFYAFLIPLMAHQLTLLALNARAPLGPKRESF